MRRGALFEERIPVDRWSVRAISPLDIGKAATDGRRPVIVHPEWGKAPENHVEFLTELAAAGNFPIGVDTRYSYADRQRVRRSGLGTLIQHYSVSQENKFFPDAGSGGNRWEYRRPTALLHLLNIIGLGDCPRAYVGASDGGRVVTLAAEATPELTKQVVLVNPAGAGDSSHGFRRMARSNYETAAGMMRGQQPLVPTIISAAGSTAYALSHPRRIWHERAVIYKANLWSNIDHLTTEGVPVDLLHAKDDLLVSFEDSAAHAAQRPAVGFHATEGGHSNVYGSAVRQLIIAQLAKTL